MGGREGWRGGVGEGGREGWRGRGGGRGREGEREKEPYQSYEEEDQVAEGTLPCG